MTEVDDMQLLSNGSGDVTEGRIADSRWVGDDPLVVSETIWED